MEIFSTPTTHGHRYRVPDAHDGDCRPDLLGPRRDWYPLAVISPVKSSSGLQNTKSPQQCSPFAPVPTDLSSAVGVDAVLLQEMLGSLFEWSKNSLIPVDDSTPCDGFRVGVQESAYVPGPRTWPTSTTLFQHPTKWFVATTHQTPPRSCRLPPDNWCSFGLLVFPTQTHSKLINRGLLLHNSWILPSLLINYSPHEFPAAASPKFSYPCPLLRLSSGSAQLHERCPERCFRLRLQQDPLEIGQLSAQC